MVQAETTYTVTIRKDRIQNNVSIDRNKLVARRNDEPSPEEILVNIASTQRNQGETGY